MENKKVAFITLGCKVNQYETNAMCEKFINKGYEVVEKEEKADIYIVNTCTVTNMSDRKSRQMLRRVKEINEKAIIVACGCYAQVAKEELEKIGVDKTQIEKIIAFIQIDGTNDDKLLKLENLNFENETFKLGLQELKEVVKNMRLFGIPENNFNVDLTIARGLDYYTGTVYETFLNDYRELRKCMLWWKI